MVRYSLEERIFIYENYVKTKSVKKCRKKFKKEYPLGKVPSKSTILQLIKRVRDKGSVWKSNESHRPQKNIPILTEEKIDEIGAQLEQCPEKSLALLAQEANISESSAWRATKLLLRTSSEFKEKIQEIKCEANKGEADIMPQKCQVIVPENIVKSEKMEQDEEEQQLDQHSLKIILTETVPECDILNVKEEPQSEDEEVNGVYLPTLKIEEVNLKKEEFEEDSDTDDSL